MDCELRGRYCRYANIRVLESAKRVHRHCLSPHDILVWSRSYESYFTNEDVRKQRHQGCSEDTGYQRQNPGLLAPDPVLSVLYLGCG